jgi:hypothetical protein
MIQGLRQELHLLPQQHQQIEPIIRKHMERLDQIRKEARPLIAGQLRQMNEEIMPILDDQQRVEWKQMQRRLPMEPPPGQMRPMPRPDMPFEPPPRQPPEPRPENSEPMPPQ